MNIDLRRLNSPEDALSICNALESQGYEAYLVGGCVRDVLLGKEPSDWDICTNAPYEKIKKTMSERAHILPIAGAEKHNTCFAIYNHEQYQIASFAHEADPTIDGNLSHRDFTINAMAYRPATRELIDINNGIEDLENGKIVAVGDPNDRINEDPLRILRAYRFANKLNFEIDPELEKICRERIGELNRVSKERQRDELVKIVLTEPSTSPYFIDAISAFLPEFKEMQSMEQHNPWHLYTIGEHTIEVMKNVPPQPDLRLAALFHDIAKPEVFTRDENGIGHFYHHADLSAERTKEFLTEFKFSNNFIDALTILVKEHDRNFETEKSVKRFLTKNEPKMLEKLLVLQRADALAQNPEYAKERLTTIENAEKTLDKLLNEPEPMKIKDLKLNGNDLLELGYKGKEIGKELNKILDMVIENPEINNKEKLLEMAKDDIKKERERGDSGRF